MDAQRTTYRCMAYDSSRWDGFPFRPGDIVITTPPKAGTTWMQRICSLLVLQTTKLDRPLTLLSPWLDMTVHAREEIFSLLSDQKHRRFIKTHTPMDGLPLNDDVQYVCVGRDPRDVGVSWYHHSMNSDVSAIVEAREKAVGNHDLAELLAEDPPFAGEGLEERFWQWVDHPVHPSKTGASLWATLHHLDEALRMKERDNVHLFHYAEMSADLGGQMRRLAGLLDIDVPETLWPTLIDAASFDTMKEKADEMAPVLDAGIWKDNKGFFHKGGGGVWRAFFDDEAHGRYDARVASLATPEVASWAHRGP